MGLQLKVLGGLALLGAGVGAALLVNGGGERPQAVAEVTALSTSDGRKIRAVGILGDDISAAECNVVFWAEEKEGKIVHNDISENFGELAQPVRLGDGVFNILLRGGACLKARTMVGYLCSTLKECLSLDPKIQAKFLKVSGVCMDERERKDRPCTVNVGDERADREGVVFFPHSWSGRGDLGIETGKEIAE